MILSVYLEFAKYSERIFGGICACTKAASEFTTFFCLSLTKAASECTTIFVYASLW